MSRQSPSKTIDVDATPRTSFGLAEEHASVTSSWHTHARHQVLYASRGAMMLEVDGRRWLLPPQRAAFLAAGARHRASSERGVSLRAVYLAPGLVPPGVATCSVFAVTPLAREMILEATRWGPADPEAPPAREATRTAFFAALAGLVIEWIEAERPYSLPVPRTAELERATDWIDAHLEDATVEGAARAARVSVRTLSRRFEEELAMPFRTYVQSARMMRAMEILARPGATVSGAAVAVGFASLGAFTTAFTERCGETPSAYRARVAGSGSRNAGRASA